MTDAYEKLANAIVLKAVKDYRGTMKRLAKNENNRTALTDKQEIECFFNSDWFTMLTSIDPEMLLRKLKTEVE